MEENEIRIQPRAVHEHVVHVKEPNTRLEWRFSTKDRNIDFGLIFRPCPPISILPSASSSLDRRGQSSGQLHASAEPQPLARRKSAASINLQRPDFKELIPVERTKSSTERIAGEYTAEEVGTYLLVFDNTSSKKNHLVLTVNGDKEIQQDNVPVDNKPIESGWLLKKRRKRMQGWAKRWFELLPTGVLSYATSPEEVKRGFIPLALSTATIFKGRFLINIASGRTVYHLKVRSGEDFEKWVHALQQYGCKISMDGSWSFIQGIASQHQHDVIFEGLSKLSDELNTLQETIEDMLPPLSRSGSMASNAKIPSSTPPVSPAVSKRRFTFKRKPSHPSPATNLEATTATATGSADTNSASETNEVEAQDIAERLSQTLNNLLEIRDNIGAAYINQRANWERYRGEAQVASPQLENGNTTTSPSFYSYRTSAQSEMFFDATDQFVLSGDEEDGEEYNENDDSHDDDETEEEAAEIDTMSLDASALSVQRRTKLPSGVVGGKVSVATLLMKHGTDLSKISMPADMNEPLNLLQHQCEELEYSDLLDKANKMDSSIDRLLYVTIFAISGYASSHHRIHRKLWNPLMSETFECQRPDKGFQFISEKVSHKPDVMACHAESKNFKFWQSPHLSNKFKSISLSFRPGFTTEISSEGLTHVVLADHADEFDYDKPKTEIRVKTTSKELLHLGKMEVKNRHTNERCEVNFKEERVVEVECFSADNIAVRWLKGKWNESLFENEKEIWKAKSPPEENKLNYYGFSQFAMELNEITELENGKLPLTDTRLRPDQRHFEEGRVDAAEKQKVALEDSQRNRREKFKQDGKEWKPLWFEQSSEDGSWRYKGGYWQARKSGDWPEEMLNIFDTEE